MIGVRVPEATSLLSEILAFVEATFWPVTLLIVVVMFRKELSGFLSRMEEGSVFGVTVKGRREAYEKAASEADELEATAPTRVKTVLAAANPAKRPVTNAALKPDDVHQPQTSTSPDITALPPPKNRPFAPQEAILTDWDRIEEKVREIARSVGVNAQGYADAWPLILRLRNEGFLNHSATGMLSHLRKLKIDAAKGVAASADDATSYRTLVDRFINAV